MLTADNDNQSNERDEGVYQTTKLHPHEMDFGTPACLVSHMATHCHSHEPGRRLAILSWLVDA